MALPAFVPSLEETSPLLKYPFTQVMLGYPNRVPLTASTSKCDRFVLLQSEQLG
jgi:hypothetical protein